MARTSDQVLLGIQANHEPTGWAWNHGMASNTVRSFRPLADFASAFEAAAEAQLQEATPFTAEQMLGAYERVLGPDPCLGDPAARTFDERRMSVSARWTLPTDVSVPGLVALAAAYGVAITITLVRRLCYGVRVCGQPLVSNPEQFSFVVGMPQARVVPFTYGASRRGDPLGKIERNTQIECVIRQMAPSRTVAVFDYSGTVGGEAPVGVFVPGSDAV